MAPAPASVATIIPDSDLTSKYSQHPAQLLHILKDAAVPPSINIHSVVILTQDSELLVPYFIVRLSSLFSLPLLRALLFTAAAANDEAAFISANAIRALALYSHSCLKQVRYTKRAVEERADVWLAISLRILGSRRFRCRSVFH